MSKQFKGKTCVYCAQPESSEDGDHVLSREFVLPRNRDGLPKVPACKVCNNVKSHLEHYLTAVMPFGGRHVAANETLSSMVPRRLQRNRRLHDSLSLFRSAIYTSHNGGPWVRLVSLPLDGDRLLRLCEMMVKGLTFHHWDVVLQNSDVVRATLLTRHGKRFVDPLLRLRGARQVNKSIGGGALNYEGVEVRDVERASIWKMSLYGAQMGEAHDCDAVGSDIYVFTSPADAENIVKFIDAVTQ